MLDIKLPGEICAHQLASQVHEKGFVDADEHLASLGLDDAAEALSHYDDVFAECAVRGCASFIKLSNQAGTIELLDCGQGQDGCVLKVFQLSNREGPQERPSGTKIVDARGIEITEPPEYYS